MTRTKNNLKLSVEDLATPKRIAAIQKQTLQRKEHLWMSNLGANMQAIRCGKSVMSLSRSENTPALVIASGASVKIFRQLQKLRKLKFKGTVIVCDRSLKAMLRKGIAMDYVVTTDGDPIIAQFYQGVKRSGKIKAIFNAITVHPDTLRACPYEPYFFISFLDNPQEEKSYTRIIHYMTDKKPMFQSLGCVGGMAWHLAVILGHNPIGMIGMDYSYPINTPIEETIYYNAYKKLTEGNEDLLLHCFRKLENPETKKNVLVDLNWDAYAKTFQEFASHTYAQNQTQTINCSPLSALFGNGIKYMELEEFLNAY